MSPLVPSSHLHCDVIHGIFLCLLDARLCVLNFPCCQRDNEIVDHIGSDHAGNLYGKKVRGGMSGHETRQQKDGSLF